MRHTAVEQEDILTKIKDCQLGDQTIRNQFIQQYMPFIIKTTSHFLNRYIEIENNDELIIAMIAFDEAITKFDPEKGSFIGFAERLIKNRLIDFQRTGDKTRVLSYDDPNSTIAKHIALSYDLEERVHEKNEIEAYEHSLKLFGLSYESLIETSPKHIKTRTTALSIGKQSSGDPPIVEKLYSTKRLPITKIATRFKVTIKVIKRSKALITSVIIAYVEKFESITNWIDSTLKGEDHV
jgi:RNA polymerase sigma factor